MVVVAAMGVGVFMGVVIALTTMLFITLVVFVMALTLVVMVIGAWGWVAVVSAAPTLVLAPTIVDVDCWHCLQRVEQKA